MRWGIRLTPLTATLAATVVLCAVYLVWTPVGPDLAAQLARADVARRAGSVSWWTGWFGGLSLPTYSVVAPPLMAWLGVALTGAVATVVGCCGAAALMRDLPRPRAGAIAFSVFGVADLVAGRVTFVIGLAFAVWSLVALRERLRFVSAGLALLAFLSSPLAGLFLGLVLLAVMISDRTRRWQACVDAGLLLVSGVGMAVLFPGAGLMTFGFRGLLAPGSGFIVVAITCRQPIVRTSALLGLASLPVLLIDPGAVGSNIARLTWVGAVPVVIACATLNRRVLAVIAVGLSVTPTIDVVRQVRWLPGRSTEAGYYQPLIDQLRSAQAAAGSRAQGERVELLDTVDHSGSYYLAESFPLARGWDRQIDKADNPIFYDREPLTQHSYEAWLHDLAVGWVAVPTTKLDFGHVAEAALVNRGVPGLQLIWNSPDWRLYRVRHATPLASGARVADVGPSSVTLRTTAQSTVTLRVQWTPYLRVVDATGRATTTCIAKQGRGTRIYLPAAGDYTVVSRFDPLARFRSSADDCPASA